MRETKEVEKSISSIAMLPSFVSKHFEKGSVVKMRKPRDVPRLVRDSLFAVPEQTDQLPDDYSPD